MSGADEIFDLARDFERASIGTASALYDAFKAGGEGFAEDWRHNIRSIAPTHLPHLPAAITVDMNLRLGIEVEVGPDGSRKQGKLGRGDEFGSRNQPPHLNGFRALPLAEKRIDRLSDAAIGFLLP